MPQLPDLTGATIAFDLDGTLIDTAPDLHRALNHVLAEIDLPAMTLEQVRSKVGHGSHRLIEMVSAGHGVVHSPEKLDALTEVFVEVYSADIAALSRIYDGVEAALDAFANAGALLAVCTNKRQHLSDLLLETVGLASHFQAIVGADSVTNRKPDAEHYIAAIERAGGSVADSMMIGDSATDVGAARGAQAPVALVSFGYTDTAPTLLGADAVFSHYSELPEIVSRLLKRT